MTFDEVVLLLGLRVSETQALACRYLERHGLSFCCDFGYENAIEKAKLHWRDRKRKTRRTT